MNNNFKEYVELVNYFFDTIDADSYQEMKKLSRLRELHNEIRREIRKEIKYEKIIQNKLEKQNNEIEGYFKEIFNVETETTQGTQNKNDKCTFRWELSTENIDKFYIEKNGKLGPTDDLDKPMEITGGENKREWIKFSEEMPLEYQNIWVYGYDSSINKICVHLWSGFAKQSLHEKDICWMECYDLEEEMPEPPEIEGEK